MKIPIYRKIIMTFIAGAFLFNAGTAAAGELFLSDGSDFPVLRSLFDSGFFAGLNNMTVSYMGTNESAAFPAKGDMSLSSSLRKTDDDNYAVFRIMSMDLYARNFSITWEFPEDDDFLQKKSLKKMIGFASGLGDSTIPEMLAGNGISKDIEDIAVRYNDDGTMVSGYDINMRSEFSPTHRFVRTLSELCFLTSLGVANYWINKNENMEDWRYKYRWEDVWPRISDGWSFDTNAFRTNTIYHIYAGCVYYQVARSNEYGILASTAWTFTGSFIWEYIGEWREQTSGNDMIYTTFGGAIIGEAFRQMSLYIEHSAPKNVYGHILSFVLDPMRIINRSLDRAFDGNYRVNVVFLNPAVQAIIEKGLER